jgi:HD-GYP domain-containing protein (c-di-GMP phosphodiesterase class II)
MQNRHDEHYLRTVTELGDSHGVITTRAIYGGKGIKLVDKGVRINSALFGRLVRHKLLPELDQCLSIENAVDHETLAQAARELLEAHLHLPALPWQTNTHYEIQQILQLIPLPEALAFKLTVARIRRPEVFDHSLRIAVIAIYLALLGRNHSHTELIELAAAGIFHDIGLLHIAPELLQPDYRMQLHERQHLYAHPVIGQLILKAHPQYHPRISRMVYEHHERLDGSGYPQSLQGSAICEGARILMLAEVAQSAFERNCDARNLARLQVLLKLNQRKFDRRATGQLVSLLTRMQSALQPQAQAVAHAPLQEKFQQIARLFQSWENTRAAIIQGPNPDERNLAGFVEERLAGLRLTLQDAGVDIDAAGELLTLLQEDEPAMLELSLMAAETSWQLRDVRHEIQRRWHETGKTASLSDTLTDWLETISEAAPAC